MFTYIFDGLNERFRNEIEAVRAQHPFKDLRYARPSLRLTFQEGIQLLQEAGYDGTLFVCLYVCVCAGALGNASLTRAVFWHSQPPGGP